MKNVFIILFSILLVASCSAKKAEKTKGEFKLIMGMGATVPVAGGAYVATDELVTNFSNIIKLDGENTASIPHGTYNLYIVTFSGPGLHGGNKYCGSALNKNLISQGESIAVSITQAACASEKFQQIITKILGQNSNWDSGVFDQSKWGQ